MGNSIGETKSGSMASIPKTILYYFEKVATWTQRIARKNYFLRFIYGLCNSHMMWV